MGRGRGRRYTGSPRDESITDSAIFEIYSLQEDGITPTTFENAVNGNQGLFPKLIAPTLIEYDIGGFIFSLEDSDRDINNGFQVNGFQVNRSDIDIDIDVDRALNDLDYILEENLIGRASLLSDFSDPFDFFNSENLSLDTAFDDSASTEAGQSVTIDVLENDLDVDNNNEFELSVTSNSDQGGTVEQVGGQNRPQILFTPNEDFVGTDSFTYNLLKNGQVIDEATVTVEVSEPVKPDVSYVPVFGTIGEDTIEVQGSNQLVFAGNSNDTIDAFTGEGNNRIYAGSGDDTLILGEGDRLFGGNGSDRFFVTAGGNNTITGGRGEDQFWIATAELPDAANTITDFTIGEDVIGLAGLKIGFGDLTLTQNGDDALIGVNDNDLAVLKGIDITDLSESDFTLG